MNQRTMKHRLARPAFAITCAIALASATARGADPVPLFAYDFSLAKDGVVSAGGPEALDLRVEKTTDGALLGAASAIAPAEAAAWLAKASPDEFSAGFWVRFDKLPSQGSPIGFFGVSADEDGLLSVRLYAKPGEFQGDYVMTTRTPVKKGEWHHVEFNYSKIQWRASLYLDGRFQWENDNLNLPALRYGDPVLGAGFAGAIRDLRCYDMALPSEYLAIADEVPARCGKLEDEAKALAAKTTNGYLKEWLGSLAKKGEGYAAKPAMTTISQVKDLERDVGNAARIVATFDEKKNLPGRVATSQVTVYTVKPLTQELFLPYSLPENGEITGQMKIAAARGEYENGSALVVAFKPTEIRKVTVTDLSGPDGKKIPAKNIDVKLVKRWFRTGGAWLSYHSDRRQRNLTPDLLVYDDDAIRVDEWRRRNYLRLDYPEGRHYVDISDPAKMHISWHNEIPLRDADSIQPFKIPEAGRNQQLLFTVQIPKDAASGLYRGRIYFDGSNAFLDLIVRVLPFDLPTEPSTYYDLEKTIISHMNSLPAAVGPTLAAKEAYIRKLLAFIRSHNLFHTTGLWDTEELAKLSAEEGLVPDKIFGTAAGTSRAGLQYDWFSLYQGIPSAELTGADKKAALEVIYRMARPWQAYFKKQFPASAEPYVIFLSESSAFPALNTTQGERAEVAHKLGQKVFAHGWNKNLAYAGDIQDMHSVTSVDDAKQAAAWHAGGGELICYSDSFPGSENPYWFRRRVGLRTYKAGYDGQMLHGFLGFRVPWNEFSSDPGGDGNYRNFSMLYPQQDGFIAKLAMEGMREAYDDLRYATRLRQLALANRDSGDDVLRRESRRQLLWLEKLDGKTADLDFFRFGMIKRICLLQDLIETRKGVLPPADKVAKR